MVRTSSPLPSYGDEVDRRLATELLAGVRGELEASGASASRLHVCPTCARPFVGLGEGREPVGERHVRVQMTCANCAWSAQEVHAACEVGALETQIEQAAADLRWTLEILWLANEEGAIAAFAAALAKGAVLPEDF